MQSPPPSPSLNEMASPTLDGPYNHLDQSVDHTDSLAELDPQKVEILLTLSQNMQNATNLSEEEKKIVKEWMNSPTLHRYLRARNFNLKDSEKLFRESVSWRASYKPHALTAKSVESQLKMGHLYISGEDKLGRPILIFKVHTERDPHDNEERIRLIVYTLEKAIKRMKPGVESMVWFVDCRGFNLKYNGDVSLAKKFGSTLQDHYPERLGELIIFDAPGVFKAFWKMLVPFIDSKTKKKVSFVETSDSSLPERMSKKFDLSQVEKIFGGKKETPFSSEAYVKDMYSDD